MCTLTLKWFSGLWIYVHLSQVIRGGGAVGTVELTWMINSTGDSETFPGRHEFVSTNGSILFNESQTAMNLTVSIVNDMLPSLDTTYQLMIINVSQVLTALWHASGNRYPVVLQKMSRPYKFFYPVVNLARVCHCEHSTLQAAPLNPPVVILWCILVIISCYAQHHLFINIK